LCLIFYHFSSQFLLERGATVSSDCVSLAIEQRLSKVFSVLLERAPQVSADGASGASGALQTAISTGQA
jgi:hypothetical protein